MHSVLSGFKDHRRFNILLQRDYRCALYKKMEYLLSGSFVLYRDKKKEKAYNIEVVI